MSRDRRLGRGVADSATATQPGFPKVRHFGFLSPRGGLLPEAVRWLILLFLGRLLPLRGAALEVPRPPCSPRCPACGGVLLVVGFAPALAPAVAIFDTS